MTYPYIPSGQFPTEASTAYSAYWPYFTSSPNRRTSTGRYFAGAVLLLGLAAYLVSYGAVRGLGDMGWAVRFSSLAAIVAALGLLPRQTVHAKLVVALAVPAFLESLSRWVTASNTPNPRSMAIAIVVLTALQASAAIAALLTDLGVGATPDHRPAAYDPYDYYAQVAQRYYAANPQQPQRDTVQTQASAQAQAAASVEAPASAAERDALYAEYLSVQQPGASPATSSPRADGLTQSVRPSPGSRLPTTGPADNVRPEFDPSRQFRTESPPA